MNNCKFPQHHWTYHWQGAEWLESNRSDPDTWEYYYRDSRNATCITLNCWSGCFSVEIPKKKSFGSERKRYDQFLR